MNDSTLLGWTLEEFAFAAEEYREKTGKSPLSTLEGACDVQAYWIAAHNQRRVTVESLSPGRSIPADLGWARALFQKTRAALQKNKDYHHG
jgi:hypothetical protein